MTHTLTSRIWFELIALSLIWGGSFLSIRIALDEVPFLTAVLHRTGWAMIILWGVALATGHKIPRPGKVWIGFLGMGLLNNVIPFSLMAWGQLHIESGLTSIFNAATAIFGILVAALILADERLTLNRIVGVAVGFAGVCVAIGLEALKGFDIRSVAQLAVLAGTLSYAFAGVWARRWLAGLPPVVAAAGMLTGSTFVMVPLVYWVDGIPSLGLKSITWIAILYYAGIATALAYLLYYRVLARAGSGSLMLCTLLIPPVAITLGALVRDETLPANAYVGFMILALGLIILDGRALAWLRRLR